MATATDLKTELIAQFDAVLAVAKIDNMQEIFNKGFKNYELAVNNPNGGKDAIGIRDNFVTGDDRQYTIYIRISSQQLTSNKDIISETILTSGEFDTQELAFVTQLETYRDQIYTNSVNMVNAIGTNMVTILS